MNLKEIFASDVTRDIPPVVYFHQEQPEELAAEVREYIVTGGYPEGDPRRQRIPDGIHDQFVRLLNNLQAELAKPSGSDLPACWISGFFGSGKSSFAKLLGYSLDGRCLPDGRSLAQALIERDDSPLQSEFRQAWEKLTQSLDSMAVVFDIGGSAKDDEHVHSTVRRKIQARLGYCETSAAVADYELRLESDGRWMTFKETVQSALQRPWEKVVKERLVEDSFSLVMHKMFPELYAVATDWLDLKGGGSSSKGASVEETVADIQKMLQHRAPAKTVFLVVDEVSQYIHQNDQRMLKLQAFVEALGQRLKGKVWLLATGQQKLEEDLDGSSLSKLKDRFPNRLRVHLSPTNIRDVVHKRLLKKTPAGETSLRALYQQHQHSLRLCAFSSSALTETDFLEVYPLLPGYVDLLMEITTQLRARSSRMKGDDHAIRGLLQLLGELFRQQKLGEQPLGRLVTIDQIYDIQHTALDADIQNTMARIQGHDEVSCDQLALQVAKAVALLQQVQESRPTMAELVAQCLYANLGAPSNKELVEKSLQKLQELSLVSYSQEKGYRIQSSAEQEWASERESLPASQQGVVELIKEKLKNQLGTSDRPKLRNRPFMLGALFSDSRSAREERVLRSDDSAQVVIDFQYMTNQEDRREERWLRESDQELRRNRLVWVSGSQGPLEAKAKELLRSKQMVERYGARQSNLGEGKRSAFHYEQSRMSQLDEQLGALVAETFLDGAVYFRSRKLETRRFGHSFAKVVTGACEDILPQLYEHFNELAISDSELKQLFENHLSGASPKFFREGLGILEIDGGKVEPQCTGDVPSRIRDWIQAEDGSSGDRLIAHFGGPPFGYASDVVRACTLGLLRGSSCHIQSSQGTVKSYRDPGAQDIFLSDREFKKVEILPAGEQQLKAADRIQIRKLFEELSGQSYENENEILADAAFSHLSQFNLDWRALQERLRTVPYPIQLPDNVAQLDQVVAKCLRSRQVEATLLAVRKHVNELRDGVQNLRIYLAEIQSDQLDQLSRAALSLKDPLRQLQDLEGGEEEVERTASQIREILQGPVPWREVHRLRPLLDRADQLYREKRQFLLDRQQELLEQACERVKLRSGYSKLTLEQSEKVLRNLRDQLHPPSLEAKTPELIVLRDSFPHRLQQGEQRANECLDEILSEVGRVQVISFKPEISGRELSSEAEVDNLLGELRVRLLAQLRPNSRIRLL